jgi:hypothetical protein
MSKRNPTPARRSLGLRPQAEGLEARQLLSQSAGPGGPAGLVVGAPLTGHPSAQVSGTDPDGAKWTLKLYGPGTLNVVDTNGFAFTKATKNQEASIATITVGGAITTETRLVGTVTPAPDGDSNVYFQDLVVTPTGELGRIDAGQVSNFKQQALGIAAIDMPDFYLAHTETTKPSTASPIHTSAEEAGLINIPGGVITLRFGGVDADYTPPGGTPLNQTGQTNEFAISLGLPLVVGTSVIVNSITSDAQADSSDASTPFQDMVTFLVSGRLNLFQANTINGNPTADLLPSQFGTSEPSTGNPGGTFLIAQGSAAGTGQIGNVRVGGNATNFTTIVDEYPLTESPVEGALDAKISNYFIGGETNNVMLIAPSGSRNISFGLGMDAVTINSLAVQSLRANRDATNSTVTVSRSIQNLFIGGNVENTNIQAGYGQGLFEDAASPATTLFAQNTGVFFGDPPPTISDPRIGEDSQLLEPYAQNGGSIAGRIAGNIVNSVISASVDPDPSGISAIGTTFEPKSAEEFPFGSPDNLLLPRGVINVKFEGTIDNSTNPLVSSSTPSAAFFAHVVHVKKGPVIPPSVPYEPYVAPTKYYRGQITLTGAFKVDHIPANLKMLHEAQRAAERKASKS